MESTYRFIALVVALFVVSGTVVVGVTGVAAAGGSGGDAPVIAFADGSGTLTWATDGGNTSSLGPTAGVAGSSRDLDGDGRLETPYVNSDGDVGIVDGGGEQSVLVAGVADKQKSKVAIGRWNGSARSVFYVDASSDSIYRVAPGGSPVRVTSTSGGQAMAVAGFGDVDGDGADELGFVGTSAGLKYLDDDGSVVDVGVTLGVNNGVGVGAPRDFDGDGVARIPVVTTSQNVALVAADGRTRTINASGINAKKSPVAGADLAGDDDLELVYSTGNGNVAYVGLGGNHSLVRDAGGNAVTVDPEVGVASVPVSPPRVSNYSVSNPSGRTVRVAFDANERLSNVTVAVDGAANATLTEADATVSGTGPYHYVLDYDAPVDGTYSATLRTAEGDAGVDGADNQTDSVAVSTPAPAVDNVTADAVGGDDVVGANETVRVRATVSHTANLSTVRANVSGFGAGTVSLHRAAGTADAWVGNATVGTDAGAGDRRVTVTAENEYDKVDSGNSNALSVDTVAPRVDAGPARTVREDTAVTFDADGTTDATSLSYDWTFDDGATASGTAVTHVFADPGTYTVTLRATDAAGNVATDSVTVNVTDADDGTTTVVETRTVTETVTEVVYRNRTATGGNDTATSDSTCASPCVLDTATATANDSVARFDDGPVTRVTTNATNATVRVETFARVPGNESVDDIVLSSFRVGTGGPAEPTRLRVPVDGSVPTERVTLLALTPTGWERVPTSVRSTAAGPVLAADVGDATTFALVYRPCSGSATATATPSPSPTPSATPTATPAATQPQSTDTPQPSTGGPSWFSPLGALLTGLGAVVVSAGKLLLGSS